MRRVLRLLAVGVPLVLVVDCGGESTKPSEPRPTPGRVPDPPATAEALALARAQCDYIERCDPDAMFSFQENSRAACEEYFTCLASPRIGQLVSLGECLESFRSGECPDLAKEQFHPYYGRFFPWGAACGALDLPDLEDRLAPPPDAPSSGEPCLEVPRSERAVCDVESDCVVDDIPVIGLYYCGTCEPRIALGEPCDGAVRCVDGSACVMGECRERRDLGEPCEFSEECATRVCDGSVCASSTDLRRPYADVVDRECDADGGCGNQFGLACVEGTCSALANEGEPCGAYPPFQAPPCRLGQLCIGDRCVAVGCSIDIGEPCTWFCTGGTGGCVDGECQPADELGDPCTFECMNGLRCDSLECVPAPADNGARCDYDEDCASYFCPRDLSEHCGDGGCSIPRCDGCGSCADPPTIERCE